MKIFAADPSVTELGKLGGEGLGPFGNYNFGVGEIGGTNALKAVTGGISGIIGLFTIIGTIWFMFQFIIGGYNWITSGGDKTKLGEARERITNAFVGLLIVIAGWSVLALLGIFLGIDTVISSPATLIQQLKLKTP